MTKPTKEHQGLIEMTDCDLSIVKKCDLLGICKSTHYIKKRRI